MRASIAILCSHLGCCESFFPRIFGAIASIPVCKTYINTMVDATMFQLRANNVKMLQSVLAMIKTKDKQVLSQTVTERMPNNMRHVSGITGLCGDCQLRWVVSEDARRFQDTSGTDLPHSTGRRDTSCDGNIDHHLIIITPPT